MAKLQQGCNTMQMGTLAAALKETGDWERAKAALPMVDPKSLDEGFKEWAFKQANIDLKKYEARERSRHEAAEKAEAAGGKKPDPLK